MSLSGPSNAIFPYLDLCIIYLIDLQIGSIMLLEPFSDIRQGKH